MGSKKKTAAAAKINGRIAIADRDDAAGLAARVGEAPARDGHIAWRSIGRGVSEFYLQVDQGGTPAVYKAPLGEADGQVVCTGRTRCREIIRELTGRTPSELKLTFPRGNDPEPEAGAAQTPAPAGKPAKAPRAGSEGRGPSGLDLAAEVLAKAGKPMRVNEITEAVIAAGWKTSGKTPAATLNAAIIREIAAKGVDSRFAKKDRGLFVRVGKVA